MKYEHEVAVEIACNRKFREAMIEPLEITISAIREAGLDVTDPIIRLSVLKLALDIWADIDWS